MNNDLIRREALKDAIMQEVYKDRVGVFVARRIFKLIDNAPTVDTKELKPLVDKVVEILPELTDAIITELPKMVSGKIKCSECPFYTNTFNDEWVRKEDLIHNIAKQYSDHNELIPIWLSTGDMKGGKNERS